jgi:Na+-driven multidrug efflux pump
VSLAAQSVLMTTFAFTYMVPMGLAVAASTRVGHLLGANEPARARLAGRVAVLVGTGTTTPLAASQILRLIVPVAIATITAVVLFATRYYVGFLFLNDPAVVALVGFVLNVACVYVVLDGVQGTSVGVLRGCGRQRAAALSVTIAYYAIGMCLTCMPGLVFSLTSMQVSRSEEHLRSRPIGACLACGLVRRSHCVVCRANFGSIQGMLSAVSTLAVLYSVLLWKADWMQMALDARNQNRVHTPSTELASLAGSYKAMVRSDPRLMYP